MTKTHAAPDALTLRALIETADRDLGLPPERVLSLVTSLYEASWLTHPDADIPVTLSEAARAYIRIEYGADYAAPDAVVSAGLAPADVRRIPDDLPGDGVALYTLVWKRFIAAHMTPAQERITGAGLLVGATVGNPYPLELRATASRLHFDGWRRVLPLPATADFTHPQWVEGSALQAAEVVVESIPSEPAPGFTRAGLIGALTEVGLSVETAVMALQTLFTAQHVSGDSALTLTETGRAVSAYLTEAFGELTSPAHAAELHADIDGIASGERERLQVLRAFWSAHRAALHPISDVSKASELKPLVLRPAEEV